jgi:hypothetical protein
VKNLPPMVRTLLAVSPMYNLCEVFEYAASPTFSDVGAEVTSENFS